MSWGGGGVHLGGGMGCGGKRMRLCACVIDSARAPRHTDEKHKTKKGTTNGTQIENRGPPFVLFFFGLASSRLAVRINPHLSRLQKAAIHLLLVRYLWSLEKIIKSS